MTFEWHIEKEAENIAKHGVDFVEAQEAFLDPQRVVAVDEAHSKSEPRLFCIGRVPSTGTGGVLTVRFTRRGDSIRILGAGYWRKGKKIYEETNR